MLLSPFFFSHSICYNQPKWCFKFVSCKVEACHILRFFFVFSDLRREVDVHFCLCCNHRLFTLSSTPLKPHNHFELKIGGKFLVWSPFRIMSDRSVHLQIWLPLSKLEIHVHVSTFYISSETAYISQFEPNFARRVLDWFS